MDKLLTKDIKLLSDNEVTALIGEAEASVMLNPTVSWAKFVLTDDLPNGNKQRIPADEFDNIIKSGLHMPLKMAEGGIEDGHKFSKPLGVITHLRRIVEDGVNKVIALAALWNTERQADITRIKSLVEDGEEINVSWELAYGRSVANEGGIEDLRDVVLNAATIVAKPAYQGRTRFLAVAEEDKEDKTEEVNVEELERIKQELAELKAKYDAAVAQLQEKETALASVAEEKKGLETELTSLREFKSNLEAEEAKAAKLVAIKTKFSEAGLTKDETYFAENEAMLLGLDEPALDFMVQELAAFSKNAEASSRSNPRIPNIPGEVGEDNSVKEMVKALRERKAKKTVGDK